MAIDQTTQIGPDGARYTIGAVPATESEDLVATILRVHGTAADGDVVWFDPTSGRAEWVDVDTAINYS